MKNEEIWQAALGELELTLSKVKFTTWFKHTTILSKNEGEFTIGVPNAFTREWLKNKYHKNISQVLQNVTSTRVTKITYELHTQFKAKKEEESQQQQKQQTTNKQPTQQQLTPQTLNLNPKYVFESFIVGTSNELARAAAAAVANNPGSIYNPLFIYGGVGLGKTHLVQAIGNKVLQDNPNTNVVYITCERFIDDFITFIRNEKGKTGKSAFKKKYRSADILIVDDIQFLSGKEGTQDEFFHTFNELYHNNKQVILTSDRPPKAIAALEDRLLSRFEGGMVADVSLPDQETRKAILESKCREKGLALPNNVLTYIADNIQHNIRELEGVLSRVIAHCQINNTPPTEEIVKSIFSSVTNTQKSRNVTPKKIIETVAGFYNLETEMLIAKNRKKEIAWPRQIAMYLMREESKTSYPSIGQELGGRDHTTAMHAYEKVSNTLKTDENLRQELDIIKQKINTPE